MTELCGNNVTDRRLFQDEVSSRASEVWKANGTVAEKCLAIRSALTDTAESILCTECHRYLTGSQKIHLDLHFHSREETTSTPSGLALVRNLISKALPRHAVRHVK